MTPLRQHMIAALQLSGTGERTQEASVREVRLLAQCYGTSPHLLSEPQLQDSCLHRKHVDHLAPASLRICSSGMRCFSQHVLKRDWHPLTLMRAQTAHRLPAVLSVEEVRRLLTAATPWHHPVYCTTVSSLGLRLHEALSLHVSAIDGPRRQVHVPRGQGATDRYGPWPHDTWTLLRTSWQPPRHQTWLLPATGRDHQPMATATEPMRRNSVPGAFRKAQQRAGLTTLGVAIQTLRHAYATPLLEAGVTLRLIQPSLGHTRLATTRVSLPLTQTGHEDASTRIHALMHGLAS